MTKPKIQNLGKIGDARLDLIPRLDECNPGIRPVEYNVIVATVPATETDSEGGKKIGSLWVPEESAETLDLAMQVGRIVAQSPLAYSFDDWGASAPLQPQIGQAVWFARYAGKDFTGVDGRQYRILKDKDIGAVIEEAAVVQQKEVAEGPPCTCDAAILAPHAEDCERLLWFRRNYPHAATAVLDTRDHPEAWVDPDDAPEWPDEVFDRAAVYRGDKLLRPATGTLTKKFGT